MEQYMSIINPLRRRQPFSNQCGQTLIIDLNNFNLEILNNIIAALKLILSIAGSIRGSNRIPAFELSLLTSVFTSIFELDVIRGNFAKITFGLHSLPNYCQINEKISVQAYTDILFSAIRFAVQTYKLKQEKKYWISNIPKIEITIITTKNGETVREYIESFIENVEVSKIHKIKVIQVQNPEELKLRIHENMEIATFIENIFLNGNSYSHFQEYFKQWLIDQCLDTDVLIYFPDISSPKLTIKCDIHECIVNPLLLPIGHRFYLPVDSSTIQLNATSTCNGSKIPVLELKIISRVNSSSICESSLFGLPLYLTPTKSWRLGLEEQELNEQYFSEICRQSASDEKFLFAKLLQPDQMDTFLPYFVLIPGNCCLLIKSFASSDITLPWKQNNYYKSVSKECSTKVFTNLQNLPDIESTEDINFDSGLLNNLVVNLEHMKNRSNTDEVGETSCYKKTKRSNKKT